MISSIKLLNTLKTSDLITLVEVEVEVEPPPVKPPGVDIFLNPDSKVVMVVMLAMVVMVVIVVMVAMLAMVMMAMVIAMEVMVMDKFQNIC